MWLWIRQKLQLIIPQSGNFYKAALLISLSLTSKLEKYPSNNNQQSRSKNMVYLLSFSHRPCNELQGLEDSFPLNISRFQGLWSIAVSQYFSGAPASPTVTTALPLRLAGNGVSQPLKPWTIHQKQCFLGVDDENTQYFGPGPSRIVEWMEGGMR